MEGKIIQIVVLLYSILHQCLSNHLRMRDICDNQHIDITQTSGAGFEASANSQVYVHGVRFPASTFSEGDTMSLEFRTTELNGLLFHAESNHRKHELSAWVQNGEIRLRLSGRCHWLYLRDLAYDSYNVSDGEFHRLAIFVRSSGVSISVDHREERAFFYSRNLVFTCWHIQNIYLGHPSPTRAAIAPSSSAPEFDHNMEGCIRSFSTEQFNHTEDQEGNSRMRAKYSRVSSCDDS